MTWSFKISLFEIVSKANLRLISSNQKLFYCFAFGLLLHFFYCYIVPLRSLLNGCAKRRFIYIVLPSADCYIAKWLREATRNYGLWTLELKKLIPLHLQISTEYIPLLSLIGYFIPPTFCFANESLPNRRIIEQKNHPIFRNKKLHCTI